MKSQGLAVIVAALLLGAAGPIGLREVSPASVSDAVLARGKAASGLADPETLGQPYTLVRDGIVLGALVMGRGTDARLDGHSTTCFVAVVPVGPTTPKILLTVGRWPWATQDCSGYDGFGLLAPAADAMRFGIIYGTSTPAPVVISWRPGSAPRVDFEATRLCATAGTTTIAQMREIVGRK